MLEDYKWEALYASTENHGKFPYLDTILTYFDSITCSGLKLEGQFVERYVDAIKKAYESGNGVPDPEAIGMAITGLFKPKSADADPNGLSVYKFLMKKNREHIEFSKSVRGGSRQSVLAMLREGLVSFIKEVRANYYAKKMGNAPYEKRVEYANEIISLGSVGINEPTEKFISLGDPSDPFQGGRQVRPLGVEWVDEHIRNGQGVAKCEQLLFIIRTNGGKGVLSSQICYNSVLSGVNTILFYNEDNYYDVLYRQLSKVSNMDPLDISNEDAKTDGEYSKELINEYCDIIKGRLVLVKLESRELELSKIDKVIRGYLDKYDLVNPRIVFDYLSLITTGGDNWKADLPAFGIFESIMADYHGDMIAFDQVKTEHIEKKYIKGSYIVGDSKKPQKARHVIGIGGDESDLENGLRYANITKHTGGGKYGKVELKFDPEGFNLVRKK